MPASSAAACDEVAEQIDFVIRMHALHDGGDALEPHSRVDRGLRKRRQHALSRTIELHEHEIPDLDPAVSVRTGATRRSAGDTGAVVIEDLAAGAARTGFAHLPEVVRTAAGVVTDADDPVGRQPDLLAPDVVGLVVGLVDRHHQPLRVDAKPVLRRHELPGEQDRIALEVVAEAEVAQHLEERVMAGGVAHILEIVVLATRTHAALAARRTHVAAFLLAQEHVLELHHARIGEEQRRIVARHERARGHDRVGLLAEVLQEQASQVVARRRSGTALRHGSSSRSMSVPSAWRIWAPVKPRYCRNRACFAFPA